MDNVADLIWFLFVLLYLFGGVLKRLGGSPAKRKAAKEERARARRARQQKEQQTWQERSAQSRRPTSSTTRVPPPPSSEPERQAPHAPDAIGESLRKMMQDMGIELEYEEPTVASEHQKTPSEHRQEASELQGTASEHQWYTDEHRQDPAELQQSASELLATASEHELTAAEHARGDLARARLAAKRRRPKPRVHNRSLAREVVRDVRTGPRSLARALVLQEILGQPVSLREPNQGHL